MGPADGEKVVLGFDPGGATQDVRWHRQYLLCQLQLADGRPDAALITEEPIATLRTSPDCASMVATPVVAEVHWTLVVRFSVVLSL